jgi:phosphodiesterase/alkaline phosphatase D-like protein
VSSTTIVAKLDGHGTARLALAASPDMAAAAYSAPVVVHHGVARFDVDGLVAGRTYHYAVEVNGTLDLATVGSFRVPSASHTFGFASCSDTHSDHPIFTTIGANAPDFFVHLGDLHYRDIAENEPRLFREGYDAVLSSSVQGRLWRNLPIAYIWDDHDFGPNDSDTLSPSKLAAYRVYREYVPHQPLASPTGEGIYQSFVVGRVRYVLTDARSKRSPKGTTSNPGRVVLGATQEAWFEQQLLAAQAAGQAICWANSKPWVAPARDRADDWGGYAVERTRLATFIAQHGLAPRMFIISGDMHAVAFYDATRATHGDYATGGGANLHVLQAAPLDMLVNHKGGPWTQGPFPPLGGWAQQFGLCTITDGGASTIGVSYSARNQANETLMQHQFTLTLT